MGISKSLKRALLSNHQDELSDLDDAQDCALEEWYHSGCVHDEDIVWCGLTDHELLLQEFMYHYQIDFPDHPSSIIDAGELVSKAVVDVPRRKQEYFLHFEDEQHFFKMMQSNSQLPWVRWLRARDQEQSVLAQRMHNESAW